ncbi:putative structural lysozyme [Pseudomonas phage OBP]|uniref:tail fiber protein n=1 Tax=Pseudomonas phage OBP TaxID=1124849 RepID=UPI000240D5FD|nr:tail fiber protein [Pseudomonas phage OBP]AEV89713.1 putative structural lysozyme [Pseudomonas phage OBP]
MASDDFDFGMDWDADPFAGELDFDTDFSSDPFAKKGFISGLTTGFLSGLVNETVGSGAARMRTTRTLLPSSFNNALDKVSFVKDRIDELAIEFKEENAQSVKSLQSIAGSLNRKMGSKLPGFMSGGLVSFSQKDFSSWESLDGQSSDRFKDRMDYTSDDDVDQAIDSSVTSQSSMFNALSESLNGMTVAATAALQSSIGAGNRQLVNIEGTMKDILAYQRNVQAKMDQAKINLLARSYVQDAKFYKFMEAGIHAEVAELKKIARNSALSDYEKTSTLTASKNYIRNKLFSTAGKRMGGVTGLLRDRFSEENRKGAYGVMGDLLGTVAQGLEMSGDGGMSRGAIGNVIGKVVAGVAVDQLPIFFTRGPGKKMVENLSRKYPEHASWIKAQVKQVTDMGNIVSYASTSGMGLMNSMADNWQPLDEMKYMDYDDYVSQLKPGQKAVPKGLWMAMNSAGNKGKEAINKLMSDVTKTRGTQYVMSRKNVKDLTQPGIWKEINNITLNEVLPGLLTKINTNIEKLRTGNDDVEDTSYNYMRGQFQTTTNKRIAVAADLMPHADFQRFSSSALQLVDELDPDKMLSGGARKAFALQVAKDIDTEKGFNPYYYLGEIPGMSKSNQDEVRAMLMRHFGISTDDVEGFNKSSGMDRMKRMINMPTAEGRERLNTVSASAANIKQNFPNVAERIDLLRSTGNEQMLRDLGVIYTENGMDRINMQIFHDRFAQYMDDPNNPALRGMPPGSDVTGKNRSDINLNTGTGKPAPTQNPYPELNETLSKLNETIGAIRPGEPTSSTSANFDTYSGEITDIKESNRGILDRMGELNGMFGNLLDLAKAGQLVGGAPKSKTEQRQEDAAKDSLVQKFRKVMPGDVMGKGVDLLMRNNPLIIGGLLGSLGASFASNPLMAASIGGIGLMAGAYVQWKGRNQISSAMGDGPGEEEDILDATGEPILKAAKKNMGHYIDASTKKVIQTWDEVKGPIYDTAERTTIGAKELAGKIFGPDGREVALKGLRFLRESGQKAFNFLDPFTRIKNTIQMSKDMMYQQDIYSKANPKKPLLKAAGFKDGSYFTRDENGNTKPLTGWNEINGPVYDDEGNQLVTEDEYNSGLVTSTGTAVRNLGTMASTMAGGAAAMGKLGLDWALSRVGYNRAAPGAAGDETEKSSRGLKMPGFGGQSGVEKRLDKIYRMMSQYMDIPMESDPTGSTGDDDAGGGAGAGFRLNSLAWKAKKKEKDEKHKVNQAIINISESMGDLKGDKEEKGEKKGLFGTLLGMAKGLGGFAMNLIKNPLGTIGGLLMSGVGMVGGSLAASMGRLGKIGSALFSGVLGLTSPIYKLLKWGFKALGAAFLGKRAAGGLGGMGGDGMGPPDQRGQSGKRKKKKGAGSRRGAGGGRRGFGRGLIGTSLAMGAGAVGLDMFSDDEDSDLEDPVSATRGSDVSIGERDPVTGHYRTGGDAAVEALTDWLPQGMVVDALMSQANSETVSTLNNYGLFYSSDNKFFFKRDEMEAHEDEIKGIVRNKDGYGTATDKDNKMTKQKEVRFAMYGLPSVDNSLARRVMLLEKLIYPYVVIRNNRGSFKEDTPVEELLTQFMNADPGNWRDKDAIETWFVARFKPIYLIYTAAISVARMGDIVEFDKSNSYDVIQIIERVQQSIATLDPYPYNINVRIDSRTGTMDDASTKQMVDKKLAQLRELIPSPIESVEKIATTVQTDAATKAGGKTNTDIPNAEMGAQDALGAAAARASQDALGKKFQTPAEVKTIDVSDMIAGKDQEMDPFVMARLAAYGNIDNMSWRVEAVLRLERYLESFIMVIGDDARFTGKSGQVLELFKPSFRIDSDIAATNWLTWFRDRFLPVMMTYFKEIKKSRGVVPERGWKQLTATNKAIIARQLTEQLVTVGDKQMTVWEIEASPFPNSKSGKWADRADKYLKILDAKAQEARLKDPEMEAEKSKGADGEDPEQRAQAAKRKADTDKVLAEVYGGGFAGGQTGATSTSNDSGFAGFGGASGASGGYTPNATMSAPGGGAGSAGAFTGTANENFNPEFIKMAGEDKGIKMSLEQGEQLMLNHLVKAGFRDNKVLALALAMAKKETGGYQATVENTNWSAPTLLKYFKNIPDQATAQKVAAMSPAERAMYVYGRAPKGPSLGNTKPEDGWLYRGRGLFQLTGKANYEKFKRETGIDVVKNPRLVSEDPNVMAQSAVNFLKNNKAMLSIAKTGDFDTAVRGINGGNAVPATDERRKYYNEYLNKLRSGDMDIGGGGAAEQPAAPETETPAEPDKNVPKDHVDTTADIVKPTGAGAVKDLIAQTDANNAPSNVGGPAPTGSASTIDPASDASSASAASSTGSSPTSGSSASASPSSDKEPPTGASSSSGAAAAAPVKVTPVKQTERPASSPQPSPAAVNDQAQASRDAALATIAQSSDAKLAQIVRLLEQSVNGGGMVNM